MSETVVDEEYMDGGGSSAEEDILEEALEEDERELWSGNFLLHFFLKHKVSRNS